ncbi:hypothetical protein [Aurantiacibacter suaedae]|uniref:hypothetical protein n=1 Tax=Aurantiacibacter suaedae TaxID=2545755 RepID=UPI0010F7176F|nr:hypothetical protein [Aurantiacibacter suaedae]
MIADPQHYLNYFVDRARHAAVVGEITPAYGALSASDLEVVRDLLAPHFEPRIVVLLRDPVQRAFSAIRHFRRINTERFDLALRGDDNSLFERLYDTPYVW